METTKYYSSNLDEQNDAVQVRIEFIKSFPKLAPLMYSITITGQQPDSVEEWLRVMEREVKSAKGRRYLQKAGVLSFREPFGDLS